MSLRDVVLLVLEEYSASPVNFNVDADAGLDDVGEPNIDIRIRIDGDFDRDALEAELYETIVHEMTHLGQDSLEKVGQSCGLDYFACFTESEAFASGLLARAVRAHRSLPDVIDDYLQAQVTADRLNAENVATVKDTWLKQASRLVPEIEREKQVYAAHAVPEILKTIDANASTTEPLVYHGYPYIADVDETDIFTIAYAVNYSAS